MSRTSTVSAPLTAVVFKNAAERIELFKEKNFQVNWKTLPNDRKEVEFVLNRPNILMRLDLLKKFKNFMTEIGKLNIKRDNLVNEGNQPVHKSVRSESFHSEHLVRSSQPTEYKNFKNAGSISKEQTSNDTSSKNNYEDFYQNEGELFEIWSQKMLQVNPIVLFFDSGTAQKAKESQTKFANVIGSFSIKIGRADA